MDKGFIAYTKSQGYQLTAPAVIDTLIHPDEDITLGKITLLKSGTIYIDKWYAFEPSGPTWHTANFMRGALVHDALFELLRHRKLDASYVEPANKELQRLCIEDGMWKIRAWWIYKAVSWFGSPATKPSARRKIHFAP